jgi:hypothetical protein
MLLDAKKTFQHVTGSQLTGCEKVIMGPTLLQAGAYGPIKTKREVKPTNRKEIRFHVGTSSYKERNGHEYPHCLLFSDIL